MSDDDPPAAGAEREDAPLWTLERIEEERPELAPLARLHRVLRDETSTFAVDGTGPAPRPAFAGPPAVHWLAGRSLLAAAHPAVVTGLVAGLLPRLADVVAAEFPEVATPCAEIAAAARDPGFPWPDRVRAYREPVPPQDVPHPPLFRFLLLRALAGPATHLARAFSAPHPDRWLRGGCPFCGLSPAASLARPGEGRTLLCVLCGGRWTSRDAGCPVCGEEDARRLRVLADRAAGPASLEACDTCNLGWKVFHESFLVPGPPLALEIVTLALDVVARRDEGLERDRVALASLFPPD